MTDVFISYAREDSERARLLAGALEARGWSVWWDRKIIAGQTFDRAIEQELDSARSVVVLWSGHSIGSEWVRNEAAVASERDVLVPALIDRVKQPLEFRRRQAVDLTGWDGDPTNLEFQNLCDGIAAKIGRPSPRRASPRGPVHGRQWRLYGRAGMAAIALAVIGFAGYRIWVVGDEGLIGRVLDRARSVRVVDAPATPAHGIDNPWPLPLGVTARVRLEKNQDYYLRLVDAVRDLDVVLDTRRLDAKRSNLQSTLALLDQDGGVIEDGLIQFNEIDVGFRGIASWSAQQPIRAGFKLVNIGNDPVDFWLTVRKEPTRGFVPLFGGIVPQRITVGSDESSALEEYESAYYVMTAAPGEYRVTVDFVTGQLGVRSPTPRRTNIQGVVALLDANGANPRELMRFNEIDVSYRRITTFQILNDQAASVILKLRNDAGTVRYTLRVSKTR